VGAEFTALCVGCCGPAASALSERIGELVLTGKSFKSSQICITASQILECIQNAGIAGGLSSNASRAAA